MGDPKFLGTGFFLGTTLAMTRLSPEIPGDFEEFQKRPVSNSFENYDVDGLASTIAVGWSKAKLAVA